MKSEMTEEGRTRLSVEVRQGVHVLHLPHTFSFQHTATHTQHRGQLLELHTCAGALALLQRAAAGPHHAEARSHWVQVLRGWNQGALPAFPWCWLAVWLCGKVFCVVACSFKRVAGARQQCGVLAGEVHTRQKRVWHCCAKVGGPEAAENPAPSAWHAQQPALPLLHTLDLATFLLGIAW